MTAYIVANTINAIATKQDPLVQHILDRTQPVTEELVLNVLMQTHCHYAGRKPRIAKNAKTDMDLVSYLLPLWLRSTVVSLTDYRRTTPAVSKEDERHLSTVRFGQITGLVSHSEFLSFGIELHDVSIAKHVAADREVLGAARSFTLLDRHGAWNVAPADIAWRPTSDERAFNDHHRLAPQQLTDLVHVSRRQSPFSAAYLRQKLLLDRIDEELSHYWRPQAGVGALALQAPQQLIAAFAPTFTMHVSGLERVGEYTDIALESYRTQLRRWRQALQWLARTAEYAFYRHGVNGDYTAPWVRGVQWQHTGVGKASIELHPALTLSYEASTRSYAAAAKALQFPALVS